MGGFGSTSDPFSGANGDPFQSEDPFKNASSDDPFKGREYTKRLSVTHSKCF